MNPGIEQADGVLSPEKSRELNFLQEKAADNAMNFLDVKTPEDPFPLIAMATGIGKGRIIHKIIDRTIRKNPNAKVLVIAGTKLTLVDQTQSALEGYTLEANGTNHDWQESELTDSVNRDTEDISEEKFEFSLLYSTVDYKRRKDSDANVHVATIQTIQSEDRQEKINPDDYDLVIVDEAHNIGTQARVDTVKKFKNVVGFTATPFRHSGVLKEPEQYGFTIIESLTLPEAQEKDFLPPLIETAIPTDHLVEEIPTNLNGEIDYKKLEKLLKESGELRPFIAGKIQEYINVDGKNKKAVIAVNFVWEAEELAKLLKDKGISVGVAVNQRAAKEIHSDEIPAIDAIERYKLPKNDPKGIQVLVSPYVASEGFDAPETEVLVWASPTDSSVRYTQFTGRLARRSQGKLYGHVIDFLYQTAQYKWSYNFGQWMKDTVTQLPNGTLFQGSEKQLQKLKNKIKAKDTNHGETIIPLVLLQEQGMTEVQENELPITVGSFSELFVNGKSKIKLAYEIVDELQKEGEDVLIKRRSRSNIVDTITNRELFIQRMLERGVELQQPLLEVQEEDVPMTNKQIGLLFNTTPATFVTAHEVFAEIVLEHPELTATRRSGRKIIQVLTDSELFMEKMGERGFEHRQILSEIREGEFAITDNSFRKMFRGSWGTLSPIANDILGELREQNPDFTQRRRAGKSTYVDIVTDKNLFVQRMVERGVELQQPLLEVQKGEIPIIRERMLEMFRMNWKELSVLIQSALEEIRNENPDAVIQRRSGKSTIVDVVLDNKLLIQRLVEKGAQPREDMPSLQEGEFKFTNSTFRDTFVGSYERLYSIAQDVLEEMKKENPDIIVQRKSGGSVVNVITAPETFIKMMVAHGVELQQSIQEVQNEDFIISNRAVVELFIGSFRRLYPIAQDVIGEMKKENRELVFRKRKGDNIVDVVADKDAFIQRMLERGVKLR